MMCAVPGKPRVPCRQQQRFLVCLLAITHCGRKRVEPSHHLFPISFMQI